MPRSMFLYGISRRDGSAHHTRLWTAKAPVVMRHLIALNLSGSIATVSIDGGERPAARQRLWSSESSQPFGVERQQNLRYDADGALSAMSARPSRSTKAA